MTNRYVITHHLNRRLFSGSIGLSRLSSIDGPVHGLHRAHNDDLPVAANRIRITQSRVKFSSPLRYSSSDVDAIWKQRTQRVLEAPVGDFELQMWNECHKSILWWLDMADADSVRQPLLLLDRMCAEAEAASEKSPDFFDTNLLNLVVNHWRLTVSENSGQRVVEHDLHPKDLIERVNGFHASDIALKPDAQTYAMIIDGASAFRVMDEEDGVLASERLLDWLIAECSQYPQLRPNVYTFSSLMDSWAKSGRPEAAIKVQSLLDDMEALDLEHPEWKIAPNHVTYSVAIDAWAKSGNVNRVEDLMYEMSEKFKIGDHVLKPSIRTFNGYLVSLAKAGQIERAESVLGQMHDLYLAGELDEPPSVISYSTVLDACAKSNYKDAGSRAEYILREMKNNGVNPNTVSYNSVINAYVNNGDLVSAESLLSEMHEASMHGNTDIKPSAQTYTVVLSGLSKARSPDAGNRGEKILDWMKQLAGSGELDEAPNVIAYNSVLDCWAKSSSKNAPERATKFLEQMIAGEVKPDTYSYNTVIAALTSSRKIHEAESMLESMIQNGVNPDVTTYNTLLAAWSKSRSVNAQQRVDHLFARMKEDERVEPDLITYNIMLHLYSIAGDPDRAQVILDEMTSDDSTVLADTVSYNTVISAWSRSGREDAPSQAESILSAMLREDSKVLPDAITFNAVMGAWLKSKLPQAAERCERILETMNAIAQDGNDSVKPDVVSYNTLIRACAYHTGDEAQDLAESAFKEMQRRCEAGDRRLRPTAKTYGCLIHVWSKCHRKEAGEQAEMYLRELVRLSELGELREKPRIFEFIATVQAWANSGDPRAIVKADGLLHLLLKKFRESGDNSYRPNGKLFGVVLELLASSGVRHKPKHADRAICLMKEYGVNPNAAIVHSLKRCYAERVQETSPIEMTKAATDS